MEARGETAHRNQRKVLDKEGRGGSGERIDVHTHTTLHLQKDEELITWNEMHRKEDEVCAKTAGGEAEGGAGTSEIEPGRNAQRSSVH